MNDDPSVGRAPSRTGTGYEAVALAQGTYWLVTGVWPFVHMRSFLAVTGPKTDLWLVRSVGALVAGVGAGLLGSLGRGRDARDLRLVAVLCAAGLVAVETEAVARGRISKVYLLDAAVESILLAAWLLPPVGEDFDRRRIDVASGGGRRNS